MLKIGFYSAGKTKQIISFKTCYLLDCCVSLVATIRLFLHTARHTWATIASSLDISKDVISHALGHDNDTVTDVYIDFDLKKVDEANRKVIDYVKGLSSDCI